MSVEMNSISVHGSIPRYVTKLWH